MKLIYFLVVYRYKIVIYRYCRCYRCYRYYRYYRVIFKIVVKARAYADYEGKVWNFLWI